ncbi:hypothetical protein [Micromonospora sp. CA-244673]|uniref:hypothetical protein n=1 Tax=Micromonospora sp. CA-244673 TaxID=3239958 RepID=UPI003D8FD42F
MPGKDVSDPKGHWSCRYYSISLPLGEGQGNVAALLRHAADSIDSLTEAGELEIVGLMYTDGEVNEYGEWPSITVFYNSGQ